MVAKYFQLVKFSQELLFHLLHAKNPSAEAEKKETANLLRKHGGKAGEELEAEGK